MDSGENSGVSGDDFFGVVRRRHPDIDIVLLPQEPPTEQPEQRVDPADLADVPARFDAELTALWDEVARGVTRPEVTSRWTPGAVAGSVAREALLATEGVDPVTATEALATAERTLAADGWHVLAPGTGMPRVLAGRDGTPEDPVRREVQVVYVAARGRYAVSYRCGSYAVGPDASRELVEGGARA